MNNWFIRDIMPAVYQVHVPGALITLFLEDPVSIIDTGSKRSLPFISFALRRLGRHVDELKLVVLTHYHPDHIGGLAELITASSAKVAVHEAEADVITGKCPLPNPFRNPFLAHLTNPALSRFKFHPVPVNYLLRDGDEIPFGGGAWVIHTPGHTPGSICLYLPAKKLLIAGDALRHPFYSLSLPSGSVTWNPGLARQSLKKLMALDFKAVCFGHSRPLLSSGSKALQRLVRQTEKKDKSRKGV